MSQKFTLITGALLGALGVGIGAFGAHALKDLLTQNGRQETYELAVRYQFYHALGMLLIGLLMEKYPSASTQWSSLLMLLGVIFFSGSLYIYSLTNAKGFAMVTPVGGLFLLAGWLMLLYTIASNKGI
ncbi:MAG TPA: DUF423 domain-containing protein [Cyclobacteriaceae bacterium]|jgi:uncharacterized membrane protein YgdD (TMEM256/DUF423 family)|nr:DUF423 domain-containing protein [Cyclobacteriaceae bacterium]